MIQPMDSADTMLEAEPVMTETQARGAGPPQPEEEGTPQGNQESAPGAEPAEGLTPGDEAHVDTDPSQKSEEEPREPGPGDALSDDELITSVAALVFASPEPLGVGRLVRLLEGPRSDRVTTALMSVQQRLEESGLPLELREIAGGWRLMTAPSESETVTRLVKARKTDKLSPAGLETLSVIAYRQPVTKAEIEAIRGVQCGNMLRNLVDRGLARVLGRADVPGGPLQYGTTKEFLDRFGMGSLKDLPRDSELLRE